MSGDLEKRVQALEDERAILETIYNYGHYIDYGLKEEWLDLWIDNAVYHVTRRGQTLPQVIVPQPEGGLKGKATLREYVMLHPNAPDAWHKHMVGSPKIRLESETEASAETYFYRLDEVQNGTSAIMEGWAYILVFGIYKDKFVKCDDGKWRFEERYVSMENSRPVPR